MPGGGHGSGKGRGFFPTTQWSAVLAAGDSRNPEAPGALAELCRTYWYPVFAEIRQAGHDAESAEDLTQGFFAHFLEKRAIKVADPDRGRFRSFLKTAVRNFLSKERHRAQALKRGGGNPPLGLDFETAESWYRREPADPRTPADVFDQRWARALLTRALHRLREEARAAGNLDRFRMLEPFLTGGAVGAGHKEVAAKLGVTESAVRVAVHRLRRRYGKLLRDEVARTVDDSGQVDEELHYLFSVIDS